jgi:hypothetical protein
MLVAAGLALPGVASGEDSKGDSLTVLPWTTASLVVSSKDSRAVVQFGQQLDLGLRWAGSLSAPLNDEGRVAAFTTDTTLVSGFKVTGQFGFDSDSAALAEQAKWIKRLQKTLDGLSSISADERSGKLAAFAQRKAIVPQSDGGVWKWLQGRMPDRAASEATLKELEENEKALRSTEGPCNEKASSTDKCFLLDWFKRQERRSFFYDELQDVARTIPEGLSLPDSLWKKLSNLSARDRLQGVVDHLSEIKDYIAESRRQDAKARRAAFLATRPGRSCVGHSFLIDVSASTDIKDVYQGSLATKAISTSTSEFTAGVDYSLLPPVAGLSINVRGGGVRSRDSGAEKVERCEVVPSVDPEDPSMPTNLSGQKCKDVLFRAEVQPKAKTTFYTRLAIDYQPGGKLDDGDVLLGVEWRGALEGINGDVKAGGRLSLFATPLEGKTAGRFGIALDASYAFDQDPMDTSSPWTITTLAFVGATFTDLMGSP